MILLNWNMNPSNISYNLVHASGEFTVSGIASLHRLIIKKVLGLLKNLKRRFAMLSKYGKDVRTIQILSHNILIT